LESPSAFERRVPIVVLAGLGLVISAYLVAFQVGLIVNVWEPFFGNGSDKVLTWLPIPDAAFGVAAYGADIVLDSLGGPDRWRSHSTFVVCFGCVLSLFAVASVGLVLMQLLVVGGLCTLCLCSAAISISLPFIARDELLAAWQELSRTRVAHNH
jgi:hypothetical protein